MSAALSTAFSGTQRGVSPCELLLRRLKVCWLSRIINQQLFLLLQELGIGRLEVLRQACSSKLGLAPAALKLFELREVPAGAELSADAAQIGVMVEGSGEIGPALTVLSGVPQNAGAKGYAAG